MYLGLTGFKVNTPDTNEKNPRVFLQTNYQYIPGRQKLLTFTNLLFYIRYYNWKEKSNIL